MIIPAVLLLAAASTAFADGDTAPPAPSFLEGMVQAMRAQNFTRLANATLDMNATAAGAPFLSALSALNLTIFAPTDQAFANAGNITANMTTLGDILAYHIVSGNFTGAPTPFPNISVGRTLLSAPEYVQLEGNKNQVLAWSQDATGLVTILNQNATVNVSSRATYGNITLHTVDAVILPPGNLTTTLADANLTAFTGFVQQADVQVFINDSMQNVSLVKALMAARGYTLLVPNNTALMTAAATLQGIDANSTAVQAILLNHLINGTSWYSPALAAAEGINLTSAAGEPLAFKTNATGTFVAVGGASARIVRTDMLAENGVVHVLDGVLAVSASDPAAASSAFAIATSMAAVPTTETGPVGADATAMDDASKSGAGPRWTWGPVGVGAAVVAALAMLGGAMAVGF